MNKTELAQKIQSIEGLTSEERTALLGLLRSQKKYGLVWEDKPEDVERRLETELPVLKEVPSRAIISDNPDAPNHILIEGDNLEALATLAYTHAGKIDVIYIDPPYNTGKEFIYNDNFYEKKSGLVTSDDPYKHSKWLSFMNKRLLIAKKLLSDRGVIFISIDDNEMANLKLLCDNIFGEHNFLGEFIHQRAKGGGQAKHIVKGHDYILCYAHDANIASISRPKVIQQGIVLHNGIECLRNDDVIRKTFGKYDKSLGDRRCFYEELLQYKGQAKKDEIDELIAKGTYCLELNKTGMHTIVEYIPVSSARSKHYSIIKVLSEIGKQELEELGITNFDYPKPLELIRLLTGSIYDENAIILDFFAGSGSTLHAVMQLNAEDGGKRTCILCTNNENGICENVTYERNKRVIEGYTKPNGEFVEGLHDNNLRYYRTAFIGRRRTPQNMRRLMSLATDMLCIKENLYTERDEFAGMPTLENGFRYFTDGKKWMLIIYNEESIYKIVDALENMDVAAPIVTYVFSPANDPWRSEFETVADKVTLTALPAAIYNAYRRVLPKVADPLVGMNPGSSATVDAPHGDSLFDFDETEEGGEA